MIIHVTEEDIAKGERSCCYFCPIAIAIKRENPELMSITVGSWKIAFRENNKFVTFLVPKSVTEFVDRFDKGLRVKPFNFKLIRKK